ncbi:MAG: hypothetical protein AB8B51_21465 [Sedimentitalea sp.]
MRLRFLGETLACVVLLSLALPGWAKAQTNSNALSDLELLTSLQPQGATFFMGGALTNRRASDDDSWDGSANIGVSFGDVDRNVNVRAAAVITSLSNEFADSGYLSARIARRQSIFGVPIQGALTFSNIAGWGDAQSNIETFQVAVSVAPILRRADGRQMQLSFSLAAKSDLRDLFSDTTYSFSSALFFNPTTSANLAIVDGSFHFGANYTFANVLGRGENLFVGLTLADAFDHNDHRRVILRGGVSIPFGN